MTKETSPPTGEQLQKLLDRLLPPKKEKAINEVSASIILEREGLDRVWLARALKVRLQRRVEDMRSRGEEVPTELLKVLAAL